MPIVPATLGLVTAYVAVPQLGWPSDHEMYLDLRWQFLSVRNLGFAGCTPIFK